jgi:hypothetical protein
MTALPLDRPALPLELALGGEVVLRGSYESGVDGSIVDAFATAWPSGAPGGAGVDARGLVDFGGGGLHVTSYDPATHVVHAVPTGEVGATCSALGVASPCLPLRSLSLAQSRLLTVADFASKLHGRIEVEVVAPPASAPLARAAESAAPYAAGALGTKSLSPEQVAAVLVDLKRRIQGDFYVIEADSEHIVLGSRSCPFAEKVVGQTSLCLMTSSVFGGIAADSLGYAKVRLAQTIAEGAPPTPSRTTCAPRSAPSTASPGCS